MYNIDSTTQSSRDTSTCEIILERGPFSGSYYFRCCSVGVEGNVLDFSGRQT